MFEDLDTSQTVLWRLKYTQQTNVVAELFPISCWFELMLCYGKLF